MKTIFALIANLILAVAFAGATEVAFANEPLSLTVGFASFASGFVMHPQGSFFTGVASDVTAINNYAGKYSKQLIQQFLNSLDFVKDLNVRRDVRSPLNLTKLSVNPGIRQLNTSIDKKKGPNRVYSGRVLTPKPGMKIIEIIPEELRSTFMSDMLAVNAKDIPFAQWVWQREFEKIAQELNDNFYNNAYESVSAFDAAATYTAGDYVMFEEVIYKCVTNTSAGESPSSAAAKWEDSDALVIFDGPGTIIASEITGSNITPISTGAITNSNAVAQLKAMWRSAPVAHRNRGMIQFVSYNTFENYITDHNTRFGTGNAVSGNDLEEVNKYGGVFLKESNRKCLIKPVTWMGTSGRVIQTFKDNLIVGMDQLSDTNKIGKTVETLHGYNSVVKFMLGFQIQDLECLYVNDQA